MRLTEIPNEIMTLLDKVEVLLEFLESQSYFSVEEEILRRLAVLDSTLSNKSSLDPHQIYSIVKDYGIRRKLIRESFMINDEGVDMARWRVLVVVMSMIDKEYRDYDILGERAYWLALLDEKLELAKRARYISLMAREDKHYVLMHLTRQFYTNGCIHDLAGQIGIDSEFKKHANRQVQLYLKGEGGVKGVDWLLKRYLITQMKDFEVWQLASSIQFIAQIDKHSVHKQDKEYYLAAKYLAEDCEPLDFISELRERVYAGDKVKAIARDYSEKMFLSLTRTEQLMRSLITLLCLMLQFNTQIGNVNQFYDLVKRKDFQGQLAYYLDTFN